MENVGSFDSVPIELRNLPQWVLWRYETRGVDSKPTKVPYQRNGTGASSTDPAHWITFEEAQREFSANPSKFSGVGFVFTSKDPYIGIDFDNCLDENGELVEYFRGAFEQLDRFKAYIERSPSGHGLKAFIRSNAPKPAKGRKVGIPEGAGQRIEIYPSGRFFTVTGQAWGAPPKTLDDASKFVEWFSRCLDAITPQRDHQPQQYIPTDYQQQPGRPDPEQRARLYAQRYPAAVSGQDGHGATYRLACVLVTGFGLGIDGARPILHEWNQTCQPPWSARELEHKLNQAQQAGDRDGNWGYMLDTGTQPPSEYGPPEEAESGVYVWADGVEVNLNGLLETARQKRLESGVYQPDTSQGVIDICDLIADYPELKPPIIEGILREEEVCTIIASPKIGKSHMTLGLAIQIATGRPWLGFPTRAGKVLIVDNELHRETLSKRTQLICSALELPPSDLRGRIATLPIRGQSLDMLQLSQLLKARIEPGEYQVIIIDALYKMLERGMSENDNGDMTRLFNRLSEIATGLRAAIIVVHHTSKGDQSYKAVTDVGAGAGSIARAGDTHIAIRPHETPGLAVFEAVCRSSREPAPKSIQLAYPVWVVADGVEAAVRMPGKPSKQQEEEKKAKKERELLDGINELLGYIPATPEPIKRSDLKNRSGFSGSVYDRILAKAELLKAVRIEAYTKGKRTCYNVVKLLERIENAGTQSN